MGEAIGQSHGTNGCVGPGVGPGVGLAVGEAVGDAIGLVVGAFVGPIVGGSVGARHSSHVFTIRPPKSSMQVSSSTTVVQQWSGTVNSPSSVPSQVSIFSIPSIQHTVGLMVGELVGLTVGFKVGLVVGDWVGDVVGARHSPVMQLSTGRPLKMLRHVTSFIVSTQQ